MNCNDAQLLIQKSLDEPLTPAERRRLDDHMAACEGCRAAWDEYHRLAGQATAWVRQAAYGGDALADRVMAAIANEPAPKAARVPSWRPIGALAAMVAAAIAVYALPGGWLPRWPGLMDVTKTPALPLDALRPSALEPLIRSFDALLAPALPWAGIVIAIAAAANVALFVATGRDRRTPA